MSLREVLVLFVVLIVFSLFGVFVWPVYGYNSKIQKEIDDVRLELEKQDEQINRLNEEYAALQRKDPAAVEKVLRERHGYCRRDETLARFVTTK